MLEFLLGLLAGFFASAVGSVLMWLIFGPRIVKTYAAQSLFETAERIEDDPECEEAVLCRKLGAALVQPEMLKPIFKDTIGSMIEAIQKDPKGEEAQALAQLGNSLMSPLLYTIVNPQNEDSKLMWDGVIMSFWQAWKGNPDFKKAAIGFFSAYLPDFADILIKHLKENPEALRDAIMGSIKGGGDSSGGTGDESFDGVLSWIDKGARIKQILSGK